MKKKLCESEILILIMALLLVVTLCIGVLYSIIVPAPPDPIPTTWNAGPTPNEKVVVGIYIQDGTIESFMVYTTTFGKHFVCSLPPSSMLPITAPWRWAYPPGAAQ